MLSQRPVRYVGTFILSVLLGCRCAQSPDVPPSPEPLPAPTAWEDWILFDQPEERMILGAGYNLKGSVDIGCYALDSAPVRSGSLSEYTITWTENSKGGLGVRIAGLLGIGTTAREAKSGRITFDSVFIHRAVNVSPLPMCRNAAADGLPRRPAVTALIGARSYWYELTKSRKGDLNLKAEAEVRGKVRGVTAEAERGDSSTFKVGFSQPRYFGGQFEGWVAGRTDTAWAKDVEYGAIAHPAGHKLEVVADPEDSTATSFRVVAKSTAPPVRVDTRTGVRDGQSFTIGRNDTDPISGVYLTGLFWRMPQRRYRVAVLRSATVPDKWAVAADRERLDAWISRRGTP